MGFNALHLANSAVGNGTESTAVGWNAGGNLSGSTALFVTIEGVNALGSCTTGCNNDIAIGTDAMANTLSSTFNTAIGLSSQYYFQGTTSISIGYAALKGNSALPANGANIIAIGNSSAFAVALTTANDIICIGDHSCFAITTAQRSVIIGTLAGPAITTGNADVFIGWKSGNVATGGSARACIGYLSCSAVLQDQNIVAIGPSTGSKLVNSTLNTLIGANVASTTLVSGNGNILIGVDANTDTAAAGTNDVFKIQGRGVSAAALISATAINTATPAVTIPGTLNVVGALSNNGTTIGVPYQTYSCAVPLTTGVGASTLTCFMKAARAFTVDNIIATVAGTLVTVTPSVFECGTSTTCATPTTIGSGAVTSSNTATPITVSSASIAAGDYIAVELTAGTITSVAVDVQVQMH